MRFESLAHLDDADRARSMNQGSGGESTWRVPTGRELATLLVVLASALALRVHGLSAFPFWEDELYAIDETTELFWSRYQDGIFARPLYLLGMNLLAPVLPQTEWGLRIPALIFGMASIGLVWLVARTLGGRWSGLLSVVAVSLAPGHLYISTINRYWSLVFLEGLLFSWLVIRAQETDRQREYRRALVVCLFGVATHPLFLPAVAAVGLGSCLSLSPSRPRWRWPTPTALRSLWLPALVVVVLAYGLIAWTQGARQVTQVGSAPIDLLQRLRIVPAIAFGLTPIVAVGGIVGAWRLRRVPNLGTSQWAAATLLGAPIAIAVLLVLSGSTLVTAIYASALTPLCFVAFGGLCAPAPGEASPGVSGPVLVALTLSAMLPSTISHLADGGRFDFRPAFDAIRKADPSLPVVLNPSIQARHYAPDLRSVELTEDGRLDRLEALRQAKTRFWLLLNERRHGITFDPSGRRFAFASRHCTAWSEFGRRRLDYEMFRVRLYLCDR